jgi:Ca2+-binding EF-hand superfamily protein
MKFYDIDGDGNISIDAFVNSLRSELNERR